MDANAEKTALFRYGLIASGAGDAAPRGTHASCRGDRRAPLRHPCFQAYVDFGGHLTGLGAPVSQRRFRSPGTPTSAGPRAVANDYPTTRRS